MKKNELEKVLDNDNASHQMKQTAFKYLTERFGEKDNVYYSRLNNRLYIVDEDNSERNFEVKNVYGSKQSNQRSKRSLYWVGNDGKKRKSFFSKKDKSKKERKRNLKHSGRKIDKESIDDITKYKTKNKK